jgi:hypothetical protein
MAKSKSSDHLLGGANPEMKQELRKFFDEKIEEKQSFSNKKDKQEEEPSKNGF